MAHRAISPDGPRRKHKIASVTMKERTSSLKRYSALPPFEGAVCSSLRELIRIRLSAASGVTARLAI
jgi:hypothetical protein